MAAGIVGFLRNTFTAASPARVVSGWKQANRIANILLDIKGVGCRIEKNTRAEGRGWKIVVDGSSDEGYPSEEVPPWVFPGTCKAPSGVETTGLNDNDKPWIDFDEQDWTFTEIVGPPSTPWPAYHQYRLKVDLAGPWYATVSG